MISVYRREKIKIKEDRAWTNTREETILRLYHSGSILTNSKVGRTEQEKKCSICDEIEDLEHLLLFCKKFDTIRKNANLGREMQSILNFKDKQVEKEKYLVELYQQRFVNDERNVILDY